MKILLPAISWLSLLGVILPPLLFMNGSLSLGNCQLAMLVFTVAWFAATPLWMGHEVPDDDNRSASTS